MSHDPLCGWHTKTGCFDGDDDCLECAIIGRVRREYVNPDCVWGEGECVSGCPSCKRMDDLWAERGAGDREAVAACIALVESTRPNGLCKCDWCANHDLYISGLVVALREMKS